MLAILKILKIKIIFLVKFALSSLIIIKFKQIIFKWQFLFVHGAFKHRSHDFQQMCRLYPFLAIPVLQKLVSLKIRFASFRNLCNIRPKKGKFWPTGQN